MIWPFRRSVALPFRRNAGHTVMGLMNVTVAIAVGAISGHYMFSEPLEEYWKEKRLQEANAIAAVKQQQQQQSASLSQPQVALSVTTNADVSSKTK